MDEEVIRSIIAAYRAMAELEHTTANYCLAKEDKEYFTGARDAYILAADTLETILGAIAK